MLAWQLRIQCEAFARLVSRHHPPGPPLQGGEGLAGRGPLPCILGVVRAAGEPPPPPLTPPLQGREGLAGRGRLACRTEVSRVTPACEIQTDAPSYLKKWGSRSRIGVRERRPGPQ